jgi:L-histidine N-alpha-methyltransferase
MTTITDLQTLEGKSLAPLDAREALINEVRRGLPQNPRSLVPWMLYDADGTRLFECITTLPEYYPTRTERGILASNAGAIITATVSGYSRPLRLMEQGQPPKPVFFWKPQRAYETK